MGTCVPHRILGTTGYLRSKQTSIQAISLITDGGCEVNLDGEYPIDLSGFNSLRDISWTGLQSDEDFDTLGSALKKNTLHLEKLQLDFVNWTPENWDEDSNFFAVEILKLPVGKVAVMFPALKMLSLRAVSLKNAEKELAHALNISQLSSLTLRHCSRSEDFLSAAVAAGQSIGLSSLEIVYGPSDDEYDMLHILFQSLKNLKGIRDLFISLPGPDATLDFWHAVAENLPRLTRFVYHQRGVNVDEDSPLFEEQMDLWDLSLLPEDRERLDRSSSEHPLAGLQLECLGLGCTPLILVGPVEIPTPFRTS